MRTRPGLATFVVALAGALGFASGAHADATTSDHATALDVVSSRETTWTWSWRVAFAADAIGEGTAALLVNSRADRISFLADAFKSTVAVGATFVFPLAAVGDWRSRATTDDEATALLTRAADKEAEGHAWPMHVLNIGFNAAVGVIAGEWSGRWSTAIAGIVAGGAVGELELFTQPTTAIDSKTRLNVVAGPMYLGVAGAF
jgi:hypothetical protein